MAIFEQSRKKTETVISEEVHNKQTCACPGSKVRIVRNNDDKGLKGVLPQICSRRVHKLSTACTFQRIWSRVTKGLTTATVVSANNKHFAGNLVALFKLKKKKQGKSD
jgi:hypothetical protein